MSSKVSAVTVARHGRSDHTVGMTLPDLLRLYPSTTDHSEYEAAFWEHIFFLNFQNKIKTILRLYQSGVLIITTQ